MRTPYPRAGSLPYQAMCRMVISDAACLHAFLGLAASSWIYLGGNEMTSTYYFHKAEAARMVTNALSDVELATKDTTIMAIILLVITEVSST